MPIHFNPIVTQLLQVAERQVTTATHEIDRMDEQHALTPEARRAFRSLRWAVEDLRLAVVAVVASLENYDPS
jgi:hypothetical protein